MIDYIRNQIKKIRAEKRLSQTDIAVDLGITGGAFSKIESGPGNISITRLVEIAKILEVDITEFFPGQKAGIKFEDNQKNYGYANKTDIDDLIFLIKQLKSEMGSPKKEIATIKTAKPKKKK